MKLETKNRIIWTIGSICLFYEFYLIIRYEFFEIHGMIQWPFALFIFGLVVLGISLIFYAKKVIISTPLGCVIGFIMGALFNIDTDKHGSNNLWKWWTVIFLLFIIMGIAWEIISRSLKERRQQAKRVLDKEI